MNESPKWHGWATPDQVRQMMQEMYNFLLEIQERCPFTIANAKNAELSVMYGLKSKNDIQFVRIVDGKWSG